MYAAVVGSGIFILFYYMIVLLTSHQYDHLGKHHVRKGWDDLKIELLGDEDAAKVRERNAEALSHKRAQKLDGGLICTHCKLVGDSVTLTEHVNVAYVFSLLFS